MFEIRMPIGEAMSVGAALSCVIWIFNLHVF